MGYWLLAIGYWLCVKGLDLSADDHVFCPPELAPKNQRGRPPLRTAPQGTDM
jgi:hypothetical protein